jgi:3-deoxy-D-manno-octulosonic-acid transferase
VRRSAAEWLYQAGWALLLLAGAPYWLLRRRRDPREMRERAGRWALEGAAGARLWVHAASVGEARAARGLVRALAARGEEPLVTVVTPAARALSGELAACGVAAVRHAPLDFAPFVRRAFRRGRPRGLVLIETEIWPGLLRAARDARLPVAFVSARLTARGLQRWRLGRRALRPLLAGVRIAAQSEADAGRWRALGVPAARVVVAGNIKYDRPAGPAPAAERAERRRGWRHVVVFGSVRRADLPAVEMALEAEAASRQGVLYVVAPRHPGRTGERIAEGLGRRMRLERRRASEGPLLPPVEEDGSALLLVETLGELPGYYALADLAFVGGSFGAVGGHNLFEAAEWGVPVLFGPGTATVADVAAALRASGERRRAAGGRWGRARRRNRPLARRRAGAQGGWASGPGGGAAPRRRAGADAGGAGRVGSDLAGVRSR